MINGKHGHLTNSSKIYQPKMSAHVQKFVISIEKGFVRSPWLKGSKFRVQILHTWIHALQRSDDKWIPHLFDRNMDIAQFWCRNVTNLVPRQSVSCGMSSDHHSHWLMMTSSPWFNWFGLKAYMSWNKTHFWSQKLNFEFNILKVVYVMFLKI